MDFFNDTSATAGSYLEVPLFVSYLKMIVVMLAPLVMAVPIGLVLRVIAEEKVLHTKYYFLVANLLATDFLGVAAESLIQMILLIIYVSGHQVEVSCTLLKLLEIPPFASQLLLAVIALDRFTAIAFPHQHWQIMTMSNKFTVGILAVVWTMATLTSLIIVYGMPFQYVPGFADCHDLDGFPLDYLFRGIFMVITTVLMIAINIYLYNKIHQTSVAYKEGVQLPGHGVHFRRPTHRDTLKAHIKPTASILLLGGLDVLFNLAMRMLSFFALDDDPSTRLYVTEFMVQPVIYFQLICHPIVFAILIATIRSRIFDFELYHRFFSRRSKVIVLNRQ